MKKALQVMVIFFLVFFIENSFIPMVGMPTANLSLLFIIFMGMYFGEIKGAIAGLLLGLLSDILFSMPSGIEALILFIAGGVGGYLGEIRYKKPLYLIAYAFIISVSYIFIRYIIDAFFFSESGITDYIRMRYIWTIAFDVLLVVPLNFLFERLFGERELSFDR